MVSAEFTAPGVAVTIEAAAGRAAMRLVQPTDVMLGVDSLEIVVERLRWALSADVSGVEPDSHWGGRDLWWVTTLAEGWYRLFLALYDSDRVIIFMAPDNSILAEARLSPERVVAWQQALSTLITDRG